MENKKNKKPFILITGDDGVKAEGIILLKRIVEKFADYQIVATKKQQSAVGAAINLHGGEWGFVDVDDHKAIWVDGYPSDAVYMAFEYLKRKPDLVVSGLNHGENIENSSVVRSGTVACAVSASASRQTPSIAFSMRISTMDWRKEHTGEFREELINYPGDLIKKIILKGLEYDFPARTFWNVNFPEKETQEVKVVKTNEDGTYPNRQDINGNKYNYTLEPFYSNWADDTDAGALSNGFTTITPCKVEYTFESEIPNLKKIFES